MQINNLEHFGKTTTRSFMNLYFAYKYCFKVNKLGPAKVYIFFEDELRLKNHQKELHVRRIFVTKTNKNGR